MTAKLDGGLKSALLNIAQADDDQFADRLNRFAGKVGGHKALGRIIDQDKAFKPLRRRVAAAGLDLSRR